MNKYLLTSLLLIVASAAFAHKGAAGVVKERMDAMEAMGDALKSLKPMIRGQAEMDKDKVKAAGQLFYQHSGQALIQLFPEGSLHKPTEAKEDIWQQWGRFQIEAQELNILSKALVESTGGKIEKTSLVVQKSNENPQPQVQELSSLSTRELLVLVSKNCQGCHKKFRE